MPPHPGWGRETNAPAQAGSSVKQNWITEQALSSRFDKFNRLRHIVRLKENERFQSDIMVAYDIIDSVPLFFTQ